MKPIPPFILSEVNGLYWCQYLRIHGGEGHGKNMGGKYSFVVAYLAPSEMSEIGEDSLDVFCNSKDIIWGGGNTIEEAYECFKKTLRLNCEDIPLELQ